MQVIASADAPADLSLPADPFDLSRVQTWPVLPPMSLARIGAPARSRYQGDRWSYLEAGPSDAPALLMLHGIGAHAQYFRFQLAGLSARWRVIAWNAPGYGLSDDLRNPQPQADDYAQAVADFLDSVQLDRCWLVGNSFGSAVAQAFAIAQPHRVLGLLLTGVGVGQRQLASARRAAYEERIARIRDGAFQYGDRGADHLLGAQAPAALRAWVTELSRGLHASGLERAAAFRLSPFFSPDHADRLTMPLLMVQGSDDAINPRRDNADLLLAAAPRALLQIWQGVGHLPEVEAPGAFNHALAQFAQGFVASNQGLTRLSPD